jgi:hypothetical protein
MYELTSIFLLDTKWHTVSGDVVKLRLDKKKGVTQLYYDAVFMKTNLKRDYLCFKSNRLQYCINIYSNGNGFFTKESRTILY